MGQVVGGVCEKHGWVFDDFVAAKDAPTGSSYYAVSGRGWVYGVLAANVSSTNGKRFLRIDISETGCSLSGSQRLDGSVWMLYRSRREA